MAIKDSSGYIGLGSRLFLGKESSWGTRPTTDATWGQYNVYNQEGSRPQKVTTPIEVSQLYPSMVRRKPIKNSITVEGSYTFSLPTSKFEPFAQLITGATPSGTSTIDLDTTTACSTDATTGLLVFKTNLAQTTNMVGERIRVTGVTASGNAEDNELELAIINSTHVVAYHDHDETGGGSDPGAGDNNLLVTSTVFDVDQLDGTVAGTGDINIGGVFDLQETVGTSYAFVQTIGVEQLSLYTGMMCQSATFNVSPDDVANVEISFLGKNEEVYNATDANVDTIFNNGNASSSIVETNDSQITGVDTGFDNCTEFYPSWATTLWINKKTGSSFNVPGDGAWGANQGSFTTTNAIVPFSDLSITVNNNLEFPAYLNGSINRNKPVQTTYKEVTGSITIPYNKYTDYIISSIFDQDSFEFRIQFKVDSGETITLALPEVCITGDSLADIPAGEITLPINFASYAPKDGSTYDGSASPFSISFAGAQD